MKPLDIVGYPRVSSEEQAKEGLSLGVQVEKLEKYCDLHELNLIAIIPDEGVSAKTMDRPGWNRIRAMMESGQADGVAVVKLDRLTRSLGDWVLLIDHYFGDKRKLKLHSVTDHIDTATANGRMFLNFIIMVAQWEREVISERTRDVLQSKIARGERTGKLLFGYDLDYSGPLNLNKKGEPRLDKQGKTLPVRLVENPAEQAVIRQMCALRGQGVSLRGIAAVLEELGI
jgi:site-specific DNA recombinase